MARYWIGVVSRDHVRRGVSEGFAQLGHGKSAPLRRLARGDWLVYYSPRVSHPDGNPLQAFTAIGRVEDDEAVQVEMTQDFKPWRRRVRYERSRDVPATQLLDELEIVPDRRRWGMVIRRGLVEIGRGDFERIARAMLGAIPPDADS